MRASRARLSVRARPAGSGPRCRTDRARRRVPGAERRAAGPSCTSGPPRIRPGRQDARVVNGTSWRAAEIPAVNGHGTARALVGFYDSLASGRILSRDLLAEATRSQRSGPDLVFGGETAWGLGFGLDETGFGMGGLGGNYAGVSVDGGYALAFVTGSMGTHDRVDDLEAVLRRCLGLA